MPDPEIAVVSALPEERLRRCCSLDDLSFDSTDDLEDLTEVIGQDRAVEAIRFAVGMERPGYNLFALGSQGTGRHTVVRANLTEHAKQASVPSDWCYLSNFQDRRRPRALRLEAGRGKSLRRDMERFVDDLRDALRSAFESDEHRTRREVIEQEIKDRQETVLEGLQEDAKARDIALLRTPSGFAFAPISDGKVVTPEEFQEIPADEQKRIGEEIEALQAQLQEALQKAPVWMKETRDKLRKLNTETATFAVSHLIAALRASYADVPGILDYLDEVRMDVVENVEAIVGAPQESPERGSAVELQDGHPLERRYRVNLLVDNGDSGHAPVVYEDDPTYERLLGRIEHRAEMGALLTDFHMINGGALHRANGGYLILDAHKLLSNPMAWDALKQALRANEVRIQPLGQAAGMMSTVTLEPEAIALQVKVVLIGDRRLYYMLSEMDPDYRRLFKVAADFDDRIAWDQESNHLYARLVATLVRREALRPLDRAGVAKVLEFSARRAGDAERLSTELEVLADLLREADYLAGKDGRATIGSADVLAADAARIYRLARVRDHMQEEIERGTIAIDTDGTAVGQINGLSVMQLGGFAFGKPSRITARIRLGKGEVIDIEREVALGGPLHSKGVMILSSLLSARYAHDRPLSLSASLVFEQSYGGVDGDSASSTELYALLSAIAEVPIKQGLAVTGSVNQYGEVQAIGGVNEKIEGFFDLCAARGLTGAQGVLIPATNVKHLMLDERVLEAVRAGQFQVYPIETIDQGITLLTGMAAGERGADGVFPDGTLNQRVESRLVALADKRRAFGGGIAQGSGEG